MDVLVHNNRNPAFFYTCYQVYYLLDFALRNKPCIFIFNEKLYHLPVRPNISQFNQLCTTQ